MHSYFCSLFTSIYIYLKKNASKQPGLLLCCSLSYTAQPTASLDSVMVHSLFFFSLFSYMYDA